MEHKFEGGFGTVFGGIGHRPMQTRGIRIWRAGFGRYVADADDQLRHLFDFVVTTRMRIVQIQGMSSRDVQRLAVHARGWFAARAVDRHCRPFAP